MQMNEESKEIDILVDVLKWASKNQKMWYCLFRPEYNEDLCYEDLCYEDLISAIAELTEKKHYVLLFVLISQNRFNCHLDDILERTIYKFCAEKVEENDIQEFSQFVIENLNAHNERREEGVD